MDMKRPTKRATCPLCGNSFEFTISTKHRIFCSDACSSKAQRLRSKYNLNPDEYLEMEEQQGGLCAICETSTELHVDHCHTTDKIRGLLCFNCNAGLGAFKDNSEYLDRAKTYLKDHAEGLFPQNAVEARVVTCLWCEEKFIRTRRDKKVCSDICGIMHWKSRNNDKVRAIARAYYQRKKRKAREDDPKMKVLLKTATPQEKSQGRRISNEKEDGDWE